MSEGAWTTIGLICAGLFTAITTLMKDRLNAEKAVEIALLKVEVEDLKKDNEELKKDNESFKTCKDKIEECEKQGVALAAETKYLKDYVGRLEARLAERQG